MRSFEAMGTHFECVLTGFARPMHPSEPVAIAEEVERLVRDWHDCLSVFDPESCVSVINRMADTRPVTVDPDLLGLIRRCLDAWRQTAGAFDIALGSLMHRHGFRDTPAPPNAQARYGSACVGLNEQAGAVRFLRPGVRLDFGGVAKGFVLDLARDELTALGVTSAILHGGTSSVLALGRTPDSRPWRVRAVPGDDSAPVIDLTDTAMSVSTPDGRVAAGRGHIMDARSGDAASGCEAACVCGPSAETCEVWSTALIVEPALLGSIPPGYRAHIRVAGEWSSAGRARSFTPPPSFRSEVHEHVRV